MQRIFRGGHETALKRHRHGVGQGHAPFVQRQRLAARVQKQYRLRGTSQLHHHGADAKAGSVRFVKEEPNRQRDGRCMVANVFFRHG